MTMTMLVSGRDIRYTNDMGDPVIGRRKGPDERVVRKWGYPSQKCSSSRDKVKNTIQDKKKKKEKEDAPPIYNKQRRRRRQFLSPPPGQGGRGGGVGWAVFNLGRTDRSLSAHISRGDEAQHTTSSCLFFFRPPPQKGHWGKNKQPTKQSDFRFLRGFFSSFDKLLGVQYKLGIYVGLFFFSSPFLATPNHHQQQTHCQPNIHLLDDLLLGQQMTSILFFLFARPPLLFVPPSQPKTGWSRPPIRVYASRLEGWY